MRINSGRGCRRSALPDTYQDWHQSPSIRLRYIVVLGWAYHFWPMRGHIVGPAVRCLPGTGRSLQACCVTRVFGRDHLRQNAATPLVHRQRSRTRRNGSAGTFPELCGSGRVSLSVAPIRMIWSMVFSGWLLMQRAGHESGLWRMPRSTAFAYRNISYYDPVPFLPMALLAYETT